MKNTHRTWIPLGRNLSIIQETYTVSGAAAEHKPVERRMKGSCCLMRWGRHLNYSGMSSYTPSQKTLMDVHADNEITTGYKTCLVPARTFQSFSLEQVIQKYCCCFFFYNKGFSNLYYQHASIDLRRQNKRGENKWNVCFWDKKCKQYLVRWPKGSEWFSWKEVNAFPF